MNRLLLFVLSIFWCMAGISANHPSSLLPLPQKYQFNGKKSIYPQDCGQGTLCRREERDDHGWRTHCRKSRQEDA